MGKLNFFGKKSNTLRSYLFFIVILPILFFSCGKKNDPTPEDSSPKDSTYVSESALSDNTLIVDSNLGKSLISVDKDQITFSTNGVGVDKIKVGSILVSDISPNAPIGFLRKVTAINPSNDKVVFKTTQATLTEAIKSGKVKYHRVIKAEDILSVDRSGKGILPNGRISEEGFSESYAKTILGVQITGQMTFEAGFDFELDIDNQNITNFKAALVLTNTNKIRGEVLAVGQAGTGEIILATYRLRPFTIMVGVVPIPIASQKIFITVGVDGKISAKLISEAINVNTVTVGIQYQNGWKNISEVKNDIQKEKFDYEGKVKLEAWIQAKYQIFPYGLSDSEIYLAARGSVIGEASKSNCKSEAKLDWAAQLSGKVNIKLFDAKIVNQADSTETTVEAAVKFGGVIFRGQYPIYADTLSGLIVKTDSITNICGTTATAGGFIKDTLLPKNSEKCEVVQRGVCWANSKAPTISNNLTIDGKGLGGYTSELTGLTASSIYYVRAYAITESDTLYGNERSFIAGDEAKNVSKISIGDTLFGGIVFYIDASGKHGMVFPMPHLLPTFKAFWWPDNDYAPEYILNIADGTRFTTPNSIGSGQANTKTLLARRATSRPYIAGICSDLKTGECYDDWYLPSHDELLEIYKNLSKLPAINRLNYYCSSIDAQRAISYIQVRVKYIEFTTGNTLETRMDSQGYISETLYFQGGGSFIPVRSF